MKRSSVDCSPQHIHVQSKSSTTRHATQLEHTIAHHANAEAGHAMQLDRDWPHTLSIWSQRCGATPFDAGVPLLARSRIFCEACAQACLPAIDT
jgi:hypothetical protein